MLFQLLFLFYLIGISICGLNETEIKTTTIKQSGLNVNNNLNTTTIKQSSNQTNLMKLSEGGGITINVNSEVKQVPTTHMGREHTIEKNPKLEIVPTPEINYEAPEKNDNKTSVPKKGVIIPDEGLIPNDISSTSTTTSTISKTTNSTSTTITTTSTTTTTTTTTMKTIKKKPIITEPGDEIPYAASNFNAKSNNNTHNNNNNNNIPNIDDYNKKSRQADYIVPIVAVILSVPLVAIIISVLYKRGAEWWQHRHYRRMDFLIEGMYNN